VYLCFTINASVVRGTVGFGGLETYSSVMVVVELLKREEKKEARAQKLFITRIYFILTSHLEGTTTINFTSLHALTDSS